MLTITISARAAALLLAAAALLTLYATDALGSGDAPDEVLQGDINCDGLVDFRDGLGALQYEAGLPVDQNEPCFAPGSVAAIPGPQGEPGVSLYALVNSAGTLISGTAVSATSPSTGEYEVTFTEDVSGCAAAASSGSVGSASGTTSTTAVASLNKSGANTVVVFFVNLQATPIATSFHLIVAC